MGDVMQNRQSSTLILAGIALCFFVAGCVAATPQPVPTSVAIETQEPTPVTDEESKVADSGPRDGAMGSIEFNANGTPWRYTVVEGDFADAICYRFNLASEQLAFDSDGSQVAHEIYPGDSIYFTYFKETRRP